MVFLDITVLLEISKKKIQGSLKWLTIENRKYDIVQVFNKYQWLTILIHCNFASFCLILEIFVQSKTIEDSSHADARSESNEMVNHWQF